MARRSKRSSDQPGSEDDVLFAQGSAEASASDAPAGGGDDPPPDGPGGPGAGGGDNLGDEVVALHATAQSKYLNYALSVITSRALPDVRDGLKPVQRRILYTMGQNGLNSTARFRKCATVVGDVMGRYHPHGDSAIYEALVRMAQPFSLKATLVEGSGNFGSMDGDPPAAMRYTECRLATIADEMLREIGQQTVPFRPNYDGTRSEPVVLPARLPNLLLNGATGIAVGMATNIPPHNLAEVCRALIRLLDALLDDKELSNAELCRTVKGPDFPTAGQILNTPDELKAIYETGSGAIKLRGRIEHGPTQRASRLLYVTQIPYGVNKATLVEQIGDIVIARRLPPLLNVRDISTDDVRIELEVKRDADEAKVLAFLFKHTALQVNFNVNLTCLVPTENPEIGRPERCDLRTILWHFLHFRLDVVTRRLEHELASLDRRIHVLEGFEKVFDALDEILAIIRASEGKSDAATKIMARFDLDDEQTDAILELKLYRLARLEILIIQEELESKRARAREIRDLLSREQDRWGVVREELQTILSQYAKGQAGERLTQIAEVADEPTFSADDFIIHEDAVVIVTRDGWVKRQKEVKDLSTQRLREGDQILAAEPGSTRSTIAFFSNRGVCYTARIDDIPATTGYGEPVQKQFGFKDGEWIVAAFTLDPRYLGDVEAPEDDADAPPPIHALAATSDGAAMRFGLAPFIEPSTRNGRRYARPSGEATVVGVQKIRGTEIILAVTQQARAILCPTSEINFLAGPGKGVRLIRLDANDRLLGFKASTGDRDLLRVVTHRGAEKTISTTKYEVTGRGGKGRELQKNGTIASIVIDPVTAPVVMDQDVIR